MNRRFYGRPPHLGNLLLQMAKSVLTNVSQLSIMYHEINYCHVMASAIWLVYVTSQKKGRS